MDTRFLMHFEGLAADQHRLPMQQLGNSLVGTDRIINTGLIVLSYGRLPKRGERFDLQIEAAEPAKGSYDIFGTLVQMPWVLPLVYEFIAKGGTDILSHFLGHVLSLFGGRPKEAAMHLEAILAQSRDHMADRQVADERWHTTLRHAISTLGPAAQQAVSPIGRGAKELHVGTETKPQIAFVDEPMAEAIRSKEDDEVGDMENMKIKVDGIIHHSKQLKIAHPSLEGKFLTAEVRDPIFDQTPNIYSEAAANMGEIEVQAKPIFRNGALHKIYIMDSRRND